MILDHSNGCSELQFGQHGIFGKQMQGGKGRVTKPTSEGIFEIYGFNMSQTLTEEKTAEAFQQPRNQGTTARVTRIFRKVHP